MFNKPGFESKKIVKINLLVLFLGLLTACSSSQFYHEKIMVGKVVGIDNDEVIVCVGSEDGAKEGQKLDVYRYVWKSGVAEGDEEYRSDYVGALEIKTVVNDHFARTIVTKGNVKKHDIVELKR